MSAKKKSDGACARGREIERWRNTGEGRGEGNEVEKERKGRRDRGRKKVDVSFLDSENSNRSPIAFPSFCFEAFAATKQRFIDEAPG